MKHFFVVLTSFLFWLTGTRADDAVPPQIPVRDFFRNPQAAGFSISPNGKYLALLQPWNNRLNVWIEPVEGGEAKRLTSITDRDISGVSWKGNDVVLFAKDNGGDENYHLYSVDRDGKHQRDLTPFTGVRATIVDDLEDNPTDVIIQTNQRDKQLFDAYRLNVITGKITLAAQNPGNIQQWITDWNGKIRAATTTDGVNTSLLYRKTEQSAWKTIVTTNFKESFDPQFFSFDNQHLFGVSNIGRDKAAAVEFDPETAKEVRVIYENPDADVGRLAYSRQRKVLTLATYKTWKQQIVFFDHETEDAYKYLQQQLPGFDVARVGRDKEENKFIVVLTGDRTLGSYYLYDIKAKDIRKLADLGPWLHADQLAGMKPIEYQSRDGLTIHGYLTLPKGRDPKNLPVVVNPHGGPWARDDWEFNPEVQFLANRGYAVLQMNFRGSVALQIEQSGKVPMCDAGFGGGRHQGLCMIGDAEPGAFDHVEIVGSIAYRQRIGQGKPKADNAFLQCAELGLPPENRLRDLAGEQFPIVEEAIALLLLETGILRHARGEIGEAARHQQHMGAMCAHRRGQRARSGVQTHALGIDPRQRLQRQPLQQRDAFAQRGRKIELAAHGAFGDGGNLGLQARHIRELVDAFAADDGGIHIGDEQVLAAVF